MDSSQAIFACGASVRWNCDQLPCCAAEWWCFEQSEKAGRSRHPRQGCVPVASSMENRKPASRMQMQPPGSSNRFPWNFPGVVKLRSDSSVSHPTTFCSGKRCGVHPFAWKSDHSVVTLATTSIYSGAEGCQRRCSTFVTSYVVQNCDPIRYTPTSMSQLTRQFKAGSIVTGPTLPVPIKVLATAPMDASLKVMCCGRTLATIRGSSTTTSSPQFTGFQSLTMPAKTCFVRDGI